jgi:hypothetical protein
MKKKLASATLALALIAGSVPVYADGTDTSATNATNASTNTTGTSINTTNATSGSTTVTSVTTSGVGTTATTTTTSTSAVNPDSLLYKLKELFAQIKLVFTFNDQAKADQLLQQANQKITELEALNKDGKTEYNEKYAESIGEILEKAQDLLKEAEVKAEEKGDAEAKSDIDKKEEAAVQVRKHSLVVLKALLNKVPEQGKKGIQNAIAKQEAKLKAQNAGELTQPAQNTQNGTSTSSNSNTTTTATATTETTNATTNTQTSTSAQTSGSLQVPNEKEQTLQDEVETKEKHDNGLHLGQLKNEKKSEGHEDEHGKK